MPTGRRLATGSGTGGGPPPATAGLNWREIDAVLAELELVGSFVRDVRQPVHQRLVFELYAPRRERFWMLASLGGRSTRLHRLSRRPGELGDAQRFVAFMRAHVRGGRITAAGQVAQERIIKLRVARGDEEVLLWIRLWANAANCIATDPGGHVLDALFRRPKRGEVTGGDYHPERDLAMLQARRGAGRHDPQVRAFGDPREPYNVRVERHFSALEATEEADRAARARAAARGAAEQRTRRLVERLRRECVAAGGHEQLRQLGDLLLANLTRVEPGTRTVEVDDYHSGDRVVIELAPEKSPAENAQAYFDRAKRARGRLIAGRQRLAAAERELAALQVGGAPAPAKRAASTASAPRSAAVASAPAGVRQFASGVFTVLVGRTARQNDAALRAARGNDWWFHCRDFPGAHVFVRHRGAKSVPLDTLLDAGNLAVFFSKARSAGQADVYYTQVKYLRRPQTRGHGARAVPGRVLPTRERNLFIKLDAARIERLLS